MRKPLSRSPPHTPARRASRRPELEVLEDRTVPSISSAFPVADSALREFSPATAGAANGMSVVVWAQPNDLGGDDILAKRFDLGQRQVGEVITVSSVKFMQSQPDVSMDSAGNFAVVWTGSNDRGDLKVRYALFKSDGGALKSDDVAKSSTLSESDPQVAMDAAGRFVVTYTAGVTGSTDVLARRFDARGTQRGDTIKVAARTDRQEALGRVDMADNGRFAVCYSWQDADGNHLLLRRYASNGALEGTHKIALLPSDPGGRDVGIDKKGNCVVVYDMKQSNGREILMRRVSASGTVKPAVLLTDSTTRGEDESLPRVAVEGSDGDFVIVYSRDVSTAGSRSVHGIVGEFTKAGVLKEEEHDLGSGSSSGAVSIDGLDRYFVAYELAATGALPDIYANFGSLS